MDEDLLEQMDSTLSYGDSRSAWVRDAIRLKLDILEEIEEPEEGWTDEERREYIIETIGNRLDNEA